jgi:thymidylate kinase
MEERGAVAQALFDRLASRGIAFTVLGDARACPERIASDLDMAVSPRDLELLPRLLSAFCRDFGLRLVQMIRHERSARYFVIAWWGAHGGLSFLAPDFCSDYRRGGRLLLPSEDLLRGRAPAQDAHGAPRGFAVPAPDVQFIYYLTKKIDKRELSAEHADYLSQAWRADPDGALRRMVRFWPELADNGLIAQAAAASDWSGVRAAMPRLRRALRRAIRMSPAEVLAEAGRLAGRALRPTGMTVAFMGPDGAGKSSVIERVAAQLAPAFRRTRMFHLRPRLLGRGGAGAATAPHALPPRGTLVSLAKLAWFGADYVAGHLLRVRPATVRSGLATFDRYFHDLLADPMRYRYGAPLGAARVAAALVPGPDLWIMLDAPVPSLQARKQEVPAADAEVQRRAYLALAARVGDSVVVDASRRLDEVAAEAAQAILVWMENRVERRHVPPVPDNPLAARVLLFCCRHRVPVLGKLVRMLLNSDIYCPIRSVIRMPHPYGIIIHSKARLGSGITVMQQVTIGGKNEGENCAPTIEDRVYIGAGAKVLGGIRVGRGSVVGANAVVTRDVPPDCTVVGCNRILRKSASAAAQAHEFAGNA